MRSRILELRKSKGLTQKQFGALFGLAESTISLYESGKRQPEYGILSKFADYFGVSIDYIIGRTDQQEEKKPSPEGERKLKKEELMAAFWGGDKDLSPEDMAAMWKDVENFAAFVAQKKKEEKRQ